jgi:glycosyltransferase involved in cell wall biosynthesis
MSTQPLSWISCQLGAREHYAIPRALHQQKQLAYLITDAWCLPKYKFNFLPKAILTNLRARFHPDLTQASVYSLTASLIRFEIAQRWQKTTEWERIIARNSWFEQQALRHLEKISRTLNGPLTLFAYSYAALELFRYAKAKGWTTVLGQIDPGFIEEKLVWEEYTKNSKYQSNWQPAPSQYWTNWAQECALADQIIVNSPWSSQALELAGVPASKINIIPLAYQSPPEADSFVRIYPSTFSKIRPMRVLFLGQVILRKGIAALLKAAKLLQDEPIEFWLVGAPILSIPPEKGHHNIKWIGHVPRSIVDRYYQQADVFLFPTLSDGFGLTQLEAQAWKLPVIASTYCGSVIQDGKNGLILPEVSPEAIVHALLFCLHHPQQLVAFAQQSYLTSNCSLSQLKEHLQQLFIS